MVVIDDPVEGHLRRRYPDQFQARRLSRLADHSLSNFACCEIPGYRKPPSPIPTRVVPGNQ